MFDSIRWWLIDVSAGQPAALAMLAEWIIIGCGVYLILRLLRGTRGASLLRGVTLLLLAGTLLVKVVAQHFHLDRILAVYREFLLGLFFTALIVFQPELRRALIRLGAAGWLPGIAREFGAVLDEVVDSATYLARNKIGALIAFERSTDLAALTARGCRMDAEVSAPLLNTIFWPGSALHDMGVIISQGRIAAAAVLFPVSDSESLETVLGSRHRAAVGLTEETDAIVVIVSEETGTISLAESGRLLRPLTPDALRTALEQRLGAPAGAAGTADASASTPAA